MPILLSDHLPTEQCRYPNSEKVDTLTSILTNQGETVHIIGEIKALGNEHQAVNIENIEAPLADER